MFEMLYLADTEEIDQLKLFIVELNVYAVGFDLHQNVLIWGMKL